MLTAVTSPTNEEVANERASVNTKIAHLKASCQKCSKQTSIYVVEDRAKSNVDVKREHCKAIFKFGKGMMYDPVGYVTEIPKWAVIKETDGSEANSSLAECEKCGNRYGKVDLEMDEQFQKNKPNGDLGISGPFNPAFRRLSGLTALLKCGNCNKIACSDCALDSNSIIGMRCPFCKSDYNNYSFAKATKENADT